MPYVAVFSNDEKNRFIKDAIFIEDVNHPLDYTIHYHIDEKTFDMIREKLNQDKTLRVVSVTESHNLGFSNIEEYEAPNLLGDAKIRARNIINTEFANKVDSAHVVAFTQRMLLINYFVEKGFTGIVDDTENAFFDIVSGDNEEDLVKLEEFIQVNDRVNDAKSQKELVDQSITSIMESDDIEEIQNIVKITIDSM